VLPADPFRGQPALTGSKITLKQLDATYIDDYLLMIGDPEALRLTGSHTSDPPADPVVVRENALTWLNSRPDKHDRADWAILRNTDGRFVGEVVFNEFDRDNESVSFRIMLGPAEHFGHGYGSEAIRLVIDYALNVVGLHRISLEVYDFNPRARHVYEQSGFQVEGVLRDALRWDGAWVDATAMSIVAGQLLGRNTASASRSDAGARMKKSTHSATSG
jgi:RimJ/RimL family protein N-acetyltransferase